MEYENKPENSNIVGNSSFWSGCASFSAYIDVSCGKICFLDCNSLFQVLMMDFS